MKAYVHLIDIFDMTNPTAMEQRISYAFGVDGTDFWEKFFLCDKQCANNDRVIYLFTEYQLWTLLNWWNNKMEVSQVDIKKNLLYSSQKTFNTLMEMPNGMFVDRIRACYIKFNHGYIELNRVFFGVSPQYKRKYIDFFEERFSEKRPDAFMDEMRKSVFLKIMTMKPKIEKLFNGLRITDVKWLRYFGPKYFDFRFIEYCTESCAVLKKTEIPERSPIEKSPVESYTEKLYIRNFYTIEKFDWNIKEFNILTGSMGSGKSICVKLLWFLEDILNKLIFDLGIVKVDLDPLAFFDKIASEFNLIFNTRGVDFSLTKIDYIFSCNGNDLDLRAEYNMDNGRLRWSSKYLKNSLKQWRDHFGKKNAFLNTDGIVINQIYDSISNDFNATLPMRTMFIPASRAIATITDNTDFLDPFVVSFIKERKRLVSEFEKLSDYDVNNILHIKSMHYDKKRGILITLPNGSTISPLYLSSGQQELLYLILFVNHLKHKSNNFYTKTSIFIEEPEAHLFPQDQKEAIEYIVTTFRMLKDNKNIPYRFFITTHSPYILNIVTTMMNKGYLKTRLDELGKASFDFSDYFNKGEVSAYSIEANGQVKPMVSKDETYLIAEKIDDISQTIFDEANRVDDKLAEVEAKIKVRDI